MEKRLPLTGIRILDLSRQLPGPLATQALADFGAEVIKVEDTNAGDNFRFTEPKIGGIASRHLQLNRNKRGLAIDLKTAKGKEIFLKLASQSHVVFEQFRPGVVKRLGIDYESIKQTLYEELYDNYIECITRKQYYLKNNFNYIMTDDHETVDNNYYDKNKNISIFLKIYKLFKKVEINIFNNLRFGNNKIEFINDYTNKTVYILNYENMIINSKIINKYNIYDNIKNYKNIFFLERKCFSSSKPSILSGIIFQEKEINRDNDDLYKLFDKLYKKDININIISGDYHFISSMDIYNKKFDYKICSIKNVGAINTCVNIFGVNLFLDSKNHDSKNEEIIYKNGFIYVNYKTDNINLKNIINSKTNMFFNVINNIITGIKFVF